MFRWSKQRQTHLLLQLLGLTIALSAIVTLPVCHASAFAPVVDADVRTITEQRSITEVVTTPGKHVLHMGYALANACETCAMDDMQSDDQDRGHADDIGQRFATLPPSVAFAVAPSSGLAAVHAKPVLARATSPESPPPQPARY